LIICEVGATSAITQTVRFVTDLNDRDGFFRQVREAIISLAKEPYVGDVPQVSAADILTNKSDTSIMTDLPPAKKMKVSPFDWFQSPNQDGVSTANTPASVAVEPLKDRVLKEIRKYETEPSPGVTGFDPLCWWGNINNCIHCCLTVQED